MKNNKVFFCLLLITLSLGIGFLAGKMYDVPYLTVDTKINSLHALSIVIYDMETDIISEIHITPLSDSCGLSVRIFQPASTLFLRMTISRCLE